MSPQLSTAQLKHALENGRKLIAAKELEIKSYTVFRDHAPIVVGNLSGHVGGISINPGYPPELLRQATADYFTAKLDRAMIELEELQLQIKGIEHNLKQAESRIALPNLTPR